MLIVNCFAKLGKMEQYYTPNRTKNHLNANLFENIQKTTDYLLNIGCILWNVSIFTAQIY